MEYAIVKFPEEADARGIVPLKWISSDENTCVYPNVNTDERRDKLVRLNVDPEDAWESFSVKLLKKYGT